MQLVVPVAQVKGNLVQSGYFGSGKIYYLSCSKLVREQIALSGIFPAQQQNAMITPFTINAMVTLVWSLGVRA